MKLKFLILLVFVFLAQLAIAQKEIPQFSTHHKNIYGELLGSHILAGVNYDMRLKRGRMDGIGFRAGVGGINLNGTNSNGESVDVGLVTFPLEFNHVLGKRRSSFITGVGLLPVYGTLDATIELNDGNFEDFDFEGLDLVGGFLTLGYRFQPLKNGVMFQFNWNPLILRGTGFLPGWIGLGIGLGFK